MTERSLRVAIAALTIVGLAISAYLTYSRYSGGQIFCQTGGCETVQNSRYAVVAGVPVAVLGLVAYAGLLVSALVRGPNSAAVGLVIAAVGILFSGYLIVAQVALIHAVCQWCVASDVVVSLLAVAAGARFFLAQRATGMPQRRPLEARTELQR